jgi:hypothetical protein
MLPISTQLFSHWSIPLRRISCTIDTGESWFLNPVAHVQKLLFMTLKGLKEYSSRDPSLKISS